MKKSYHSIVVPIVDAMTAFATVCYARTPTGRFSTWIPHVAVLAIVFPSVPRLGAASAAFYHWFSFVPTGFSSSSPSLAYRLCLIRNGVPAQAE